MTTFLFFVGFARHLLSSMWGTNIFRAIHPTVNLPMHQVKNARKRLTHVLEMSQGYLTIINWSAVGEKIRCNKVHAHFSQLIIHMNERIKS